MVKDAEEFGKVAVLMGGKSAEREVSLNSGNAVLQALQNRDIDAFAIDMGHEDLIEVYEQQHFARAFIALHGRGGEDGVVQHLLESIDVPYTGSNVLGSALSMDKIKTKQRWLDKGFLTPPFGVLEESSDFTTVANDVGLPLLVKPVNEGSSLGMTKVAQASDLEAAWRIAYEFDEAVMAERWIAGPEYTAAILGVLTLPLICIETPREFYDYDAKYVANDTRFICPTGLDDETEQAMQSLALEAFEVVGCSGWGRVDFICDEHNKPWLIEINTVPGMTDHSLVPMAAKEAGIEFDELVWQILEDSCQNREKKGDLQ